MNHFLLFFMIAGSKRNAPSAPEKSNKRTRSTPDIKRSKKKVRAVLNNIVERPTTSGHIFVCGTNDFGQLGIEGDEKNRPVPIKSVIDIDFVDVISGGLHSFAMTPEGSVSQKKFCLMY
jgi:regulator of chromosome condensation